MLSTIFNRVSQKRKREMLVRDLVSAVSRMDYSNIDQYLTEDFRFYDATGRSIVGRDRYIEEDRRFREAAGRPATVIDSLDHNRGEVLLRGHLESEIEEIGGPTMWRVLFRDGRICSAEVTRSLAQMTLPEYASRQHSHSSA